MSIVNTLNKISKEVEMALNQYYVSKAVEKLTRDMPKILRRLDVLEYQQYGFMVITLIGFAIIVWII